ncbi:30S ribosomal protein S16 [Lignipirellula cremea]|uniref:Small ribosomal subunit protein bS16 n=1 Tax=Lignipirellula cremea TaxID=2528010 RepID=A0A518E1I7_9BACT|nr:30S ribosomal protein S16 [Lignipirellula cremea]QDU97950.1 30S ribosomal protein S16 [Lignipirellula cremea]
MAVRIRLKKLGRKHRPFFRVCAMDARTPRDGRVIEELGYYDPMAPETDARAILNGERIDYWLGVGAQPTEKVGVLIKKYGSSGTHLEQQKTALERMQQKPELAPQPKVSLKKKEEPVAEAPADEAPAAEEAVATEEAAPDDAAAAEGSSE